MVLDPALVILERWPPTALFGFRQCVSGRLVVLVAVQFLALLPGDLWPGGGPTLTVFSAESALHLDLFAASFFFRPFPGVACRSDCTRWSPSG